MRKKYKLKCEYCGNEFESTHSDSKTCSRHCANKLRYENNVDKNVFENWSSESAYYFGLIMSDGCLIHNKDRHLIVLTMNDFEILNILHEYTECKRKIYKENSSYSLRYWNEDAVSILRKYELTERKSLVKKYPLNLPHEYQPDFIRGVFDGDGSIIYRKTKWNTYPQISIVSGSEAFAKGLQFMLREFGIESCIYESDRTKNTNYYLKVIKFNEVKKFKSLIYNKETSFKLDRKYEKFKFLDSLSKIYSDVAS